MVLDTAEGSLRCPSGKLFGHVWTKVLGWHGDELNLQASKLLTGSELRRMIRDRLPSKAGARVSVLKETEKLSLKKTLTEQGLAEKQPVSLSYTYEAANLQEAWMCLKGHPVEDASMALEGIQKLQGLGELTQLTNLVSLQSLSLANRFNQSLTGVAWPTSLQSLSLGNDFNQRLQGVTWPSSLQSLSFGSNFNQTLKGVAWPMNLQILSFGTCFNKSLEGVTWPSNLQSLSFGDGV